MQCGYTAEFGAGQCEVTPHLLAAGLDGAAGICGVEAELDMPFNDILENRDAGFMGLTTARKGPWAFEVEVADFALDGEGAKSIAGPIESVSVDGALEPPSERTVYRGFDRLSHA
ncbi:MAG: hypothetical protein KDI67_01115 [Gammaproteobacteria bacterium]|nr:hypothetical protein [Gammaproteobacteria bacterium]